MHFKNDYSGALKMSHWGHRDGTGLAQTNILKMHEPIGVFSSICIIFG